MNIRTVNTIIGREYSTRVKKKSFLLTTFLVPVILSLSMVVMIYIVSKANSGSSQVAVVDRSGMLLPAFSEIATKNVYHDFSDADPDSLKLGLEGLGMDVMVLVSEPDSTAGVSVRTYSRKPISVDLNAEITKTANKAVEARRMQLFYGLPDDIMDKIRSDVRVQEFTMDVEGNESVSESGIYMVVSMLLGIFIFIFVTIFGSLVMSSVIEEKASRVVEVLISSAKATELMFGKIIGVALVALTQFLLWIALTLALVTVAVPALGLETIDPSALAGMQSGIELSQTETDLSVIYTTLANIPWVTLIVSFFIYFILGYLLYASLFAAVGSAVESEADTQQLQLPLTIPLMVAYMIVLVAFRNPDGGIAFWGSMIPFTSPIVMLARIPFGVPAWQLVVSVAALLLTFVGCAWLSAKIYNAGILLFGKKSTFADIWRWLRQD